MTPVAGSPFGAGAVPSGVAVDPTGKFAYVANYGSDNVSAYHQRDQRRADAGGGSPFGAGAVPSTWRSTLRASSPMWRTLVDSVSAYTINATSGALTAVEGSPFGADNGPDDVAVDPKGKFAYVANIGSDDVSAYTINATSGALTPVAGSPFAAGLARYRGGRSSGQVRLRAPTTARQRFRLYDQRDQRRADAGGGVAVCGRAPLRITWLVDPTGKFAYVANHAPTCFGLCDQCGSGALTPVAGSPFGAGTVPPAGSRSLGQVRLRDQP